MKIKIKSSICIIVSVIVFILMGIFTYKVFGETAKNLADSAVKNTSLFWDIKKGEIIDENGIMNAASNTHWLCLSHEKVTGLGSGSRIDAIMDINVSKLGTYSTQVLSGAESVTNEDCSRNKTVKRIAYHVWAASVDTSRGMVGDAGSSPSKNALYYFFNTTDLTKYIGDFAKKRTDSYLKTSKEHSGKVLDYAWTYADSETTGSSADITSSSGTGAEVNVSKSTNGNTYSYIGPFKITTAGTIASVTIKDGNSSPSVAGYANSIGGGVGNIKNLPRNGNAFYVVTTDLLTNTNVSVTINTSGTSGGGTVIDPRTGKSTIGYIKARIIFIGNNEGQATTIFRGDLIKGNPSSDTVTFTAKNNLGKMTIQKVGAYAGNENYENVRDFGFKLYYLEGTTKKYLRINDSDTISGKASVAIGGDTKYDADANTATTIFTSSNGTVSIDNISVEHEYYIEESNTDDTNYSANIISATTQIGTGAVTELETDGNIAGPITVTLKGANNTATKIMLKDYRKVGNLTIEKVDKDDYNTKLGNVQFKVKNKDTGYYVVAEQTAEGEYNIPDQLKGYTQNEEDGTIFVTHPTTGTIIINGLDVGNYEVIEINNPHYGYTILPENVSTTLETSGTTVTIENEKQTGNLSIQKKDADSDDIKLEGVTFKIRRVTSNEYLGSGYVVGMQGDSASNATPMETATGTVYFANMTVTDNPEEATTFITDAEGFIRIYNILIGEYVVEEISVGDHYGYYVNPDYVNWEIRNSNGENTTVNNETSATIEVVRQKSTDTRPEAAQQGTNATDNITAINEKQTGNLTIQKKDADSDDIKLEGVSFRLRRVTSNECLGSGYVVGMQGDSASNATPMETATGTVYFANMRVTDNPEEATTFMTDAEGFIRIYNILIGEYVVEEISVGDHYGYYVNPDYVNWEIRNSNGENTTVNNETSATIEVVRQKSTDTRPEAAQQGTNATDNITAINEKQTGNLTIQKKDADSDDIKLEGVSFRLRRVTSNECLGSGYVVGMQGDSASNATPIETATGKVYFANMTVTNNPEEATTFVTDEQGIIEIYNIVIGEYVVEEISVGDNFGYDIDPDYISWEITNSNGETSTVNHSTSATIEVVRQKSTDTTPEAADQGTENADQIVTKNTRKYIKIRGFAWEDREEGKDSTKDYIWKDGTGDKRLANVPVRLITANGEIITTVTDENGEYVFGNYDEDPDAIKIEIDDLVGAYIQFEYNGMSYQSIQVDPNFVKTEETDSNGNTLVKYSGDTNKSSDERLRATFNDNYATISQGMASNSSGNKTHDIQYNYDAENHASKVIYGNENDLKYGYEGQKYPISGVYEQYRIYAVTEQREVLCTGLTAEKIRQDATVEIGGLNLGVEERQMPDLFVLEDMEKVEISLNDYTHIYQYAQRFEDPKNYAGGELVNADNTLNVAVRFANKYIENSYSREVYASDIVYNKQPGNEGKLKIFVTYRIKITNESSSVYTTLKTLSNYYDARYENVVVRDENGNIIESQVDNSYNQNGFKKVNIQANYQIPDGQTREMTITYQLNNEAINSILNEQLTLDSISEVSAYSSYSDSNYSVPYAGIDIDSAPGTVDTGNYEGTLEDDTDKAPSLILNLKEGRKIEGNVWEDSAIQELLELSGEQKERKGDGKYAVGSENVVNNVHVELFAENAEGNYELAKLYQFDSATLTENVVDASTDTKGQGYYGFSGVIPSKYVIRYTYGDNSVIVDPSGNTVKNVDPDSYKSTIYRGGNAIAEGDYWWYKEETGEGIDRFSDAKDSFAIQEDGTRIDDIIGARTSQDNDINYGTATESALLEEITAETAQFEIEIDYDFDQENVSTYSDDVNNRLQFIFDNFDFGIIERPKQELEIAKQVANIQITLANGTTLINGDPRSQNLSGVRYLDNGEIYIEIDNEIIQGATMTLTYEISVDNTRCEVDYSDENYYIYGTIPANKEDVYKVASIVDMYDYLPDDMVFQDELSNNWEKIEIADSDKGTILSEEVYEAVKGSQNVIHLTTPIFEDMEPGTVRSTADVNSNIIVSRQLSTQSDDLTYENDIEIIKLKGRLPDNSIPGNYDPTTNTPNEPDDSYASVTITGPTGDNRQYILYGALGISLLIIVGVGIVFIKKKVL